jgi:hypothetical protein
MSRHQSFGTALGAFRNRQIRKDIRLSNRSNRNTVTPTTNTTAVFIYFVVVAVILFLCAIINSLGGY